MSELVNVCVCVCVREREREREESNSLGLFPRSHNISPFQFFCSSSSSCPSYLFQTCKNTLKNQVQKTLSFLRSLRLEVSNHGLGRTQFFISNKPCFSHCSSHLNIKLRSQYCLILVSVTNIAMYFEYISEKGVEIPHVCTSAHP